MAIEFSGAAGQRIDFGSSTDVYGLSQKSISFWTYLDSIIKATAPDFIYFGGLLDEAPAGDESWSILMGYQNNGDIAFGEGFDNTPGSWHTAINTFVISTLHHVTITYDNTNVANNPIIYVDKAIKALTEDSTPIGNAQTGTNGQLRIGAAGAVGVKPIDGWEQDFRIYNRILTAVEVGILHDSRCQRVVLGGLVFAPNLDGAAGLSIYEGVALAAGNTIVDEMTGATGVPHGSPVGRGNTITNIGIGVQ